MAQVNKQRIELPREMAENVRLVLEFHRWGGTAEGVTAGETIYSNSYSRLRSDKLKLQRLCDSIEHSLAGSLPGEAETLLSAGRMYRRSADYVKAREYFLRALEIVYRGCRCA